MLVTRGSGFSQLSSSKSVGAIDSSETKVESQAKITTPVQSLSGDANACVPRSNKSERERDRRRRKRKGYGPD